MLQKNFNEVLQKFLRVLRIHEDLLGFLETPADFL